MTLMQLKKDILENKLSDDLIIFVCEENTFLAEQYINEICERKNKQQIKINSIYEPTESAISLVVDFDEELNILKVLDEKDPTKLGTFSEYATSYADFTNTIVICKKIDEKISKFVEEYTVKMPKLQDWQVIEYMKTICPKLDPTDYEWLYNVANKNIFRITTELEKLKLFSEEEQKSIFRQMQVDKYSDLYTLPNFGLVSSIESGNYTELIQWFIHRKYTDVSAYQLLGALLTKYEQYAYIKLDSNLTTQEMGISDKQFGYLKRNITKSKQQIINNIKFLSSLDNKIKSGKLDIPEEQIIDYIICNVFA